MLEVASLVSALNTAILNKANEYVNDSAPGFTHIQHAQPVSFGHELAKHAHAFARDLDRINDWLKRTSVSSLGAGALAGSSLPLNPERTAKELGFDSSFTNSIDAVSDRDYVAEALFICATIGLHLSRIGEEWTLWASTEFAWAKVADEYSTGSSIMPQKKNPDMAELARGKSGRLIGNLTGLLATLKALPLAYNRDLQEDKEPLFDSLDTVVLALGAMTGLLASSTFRLDVMAEAANAPTAAATDLAEWLVANGTPFRDAHAIVGALVRKSLDEGIALRELVASSPELGPDAVFLVDPGVAVTRRTTPGGGGPAPVAAQLKAFATRVATDEARN
jgi:argininosuccinate lyase